MGMKEPYVGQVGLQTGEIAEDLTYYFATSEQVASSVGLGVLMNHDNTVRQAGGFIIQLMPFTDEKVIDALEKKLSSVKSVTSMLDAGMTPEDILQELLGEFGVEITEKTETRFACNCSKERMEKALISIGRKDLEEMIKDGEPISRTSQGIAGAKMPVNYLVEMVMDRIAACKGVSGKDYTDASAWGVLSARTPLSEQCHAY